jgi:hypothetical protein
MKVIEEGWEANGCEIYLVEGEARGGYFQIGEFAAWEETPESYVGPETMTARAKLAAEGPTMGRMLRELEWSGGDGTCPWCDGELLKHEEDCDLDALLTKIEAR